MELFARGEDDDAWHIWQTAPGGAWSGWSSVGGMGAGDPLVLQNLDGRLEVFAINAAGNCWHSLQTTPGGIWSQLFNLGGAPQPPGHSPLSTALTGVMEPGGELRLFAINLEGACYSTRQVVPGSNQWTGWSPLGNNWTLSAPPSAVLHLTELNPVATVAVGIAQVIPHVLTEVNGNWDAEWGPFGYQDGVQLKLGGLPAHRGVGLTGVGGNIYAFITDDDGALLMSETSHLGAYGYWFQVGETVYAGVPTAVGDHVVVRGADQQAYHGLLSAHFGPQGLTLNPLGGIGAGNPAACLNMDGRLEVFAVNAAGNCWHAWETAPGGAWSGFASLGKPGVKLVSD